MKKLITIALFIAIVFAAAVGSQVYSFLNASVSTSEDVVIFEVEPGQSLRLIAKNLEEDKLISNASKMVLYVKLIGASGRIRIGEYAIRRNMKPREILEIITSGRSVEHIITIQEGFNKYEIAETAERQGLINKSEFLKLVHNKALIKELTGAELPSLEGYLFPETYHITKFTKAVGLIRAMVERFNENYKKVQLRAGEKLSKHELVILASIIEKETGAPEERPLISSVFHNRLKINMKLQTDPTVIYGIWDQTKVPSRNISREDLLTPNRYNTYTFTGLPYGPISNPGLEALKAAAQPAQSSYLFFVSRNNGTHTFSQEYSQHQKAVGQYQLDRKAREGKSWRDLKKTKSADSKKL